MAFTEQEKQIILYGKANGKSQEEVTQAIANLRSGVKPKNEPVVDQTGSELGSLASIGKGIVKGAAEGAIGTARMLQTGGQGILAAIDPTKTFSEVREETGFKSLQGPAAAEIDEQLRSKNAEESAGKAIGFAGEVLAGGAGGIRKGVTKGAEAIGALRGALPATDNLAVREAGELGERVPRFFGRMKDFITERAGRAERIKNAPPVVQKAIKSGLDERIVNTVSQADVPTRQAYKEMVDIAENSGDTLKLKQRPEIVAGRAAGEQYDLIDKARKEVGKQIGEATDKLSKTTKVDITDGVQEIEEVLSKQGINKVITEKGVYLDFSSTKYTPAERKRIEELYKLATEGTFELTPKQVHGKDQLFSKLQRESRFEGVGDIVVETEQGNMSLFRVFRDVFANKLDEVSPELREFNKTYRNLVTLQDDIEGSIVKGGKFETTKNVDAAEFAQTNLRRLLSDAQSAADYKQIVAEMDKVARELGYQGANAEDLITFATELRKLYPDTIPANSFSGGVKLGLSDLLEKAYKIGAPNKADQQKALRELIESL